MIGAILGLTARPLLESLMHLASSLRQDAIAILRGWISRRWDYPQRLANTDNDAAAHRLAGRPATTAGRKPPFRASVRRAFSGPGKPNRSDGPAHQSSLAGEENGWLASTTKSASSFRSPEPPFDTIIGSPAP